MGQHRALSVASVSPSTSMSQRSTYTFISADASRAGVHKIEHGAGVHKVECGAGVQKIEHGAAVQKIACGAGVHELEHGAGVQKCEHGAGAHKMECGAGVHKVECSAGVQTIECGARVHKVEHGAGVQKIEHGAGVSTAFVSAMRFSALAEIRLPFAALLTLCAGCRDSLWRWRHSPGRSDGRGQGAGVGAHSHHSPEVLGGAKKLSRKLCMERVLVGEGTFCACE